jgi:glyoxylase-like metal-dependent hydrolase (beta-lactamase superfamily II)
VGFCEGPRSSVLIDSLNDADGGRKILKALEGAGKRVDAVALTHSNADHMGGAAFIASRLGARVYASRMEGAFCADPLMEPSFLYGGYPPKELRGKFFIAPACPTSVLSPESPPDDLENFQVIPLPGHYFGQVGYQYGGVFFVGDALFGERVIEKHPVFFVYQVADFLESLERIRRWAAAQASTQGPLSASSPLVVPSHGEPTEDVEALVDLNRRTVERIVETLVDLCDRERSSEELLSLFCERFSITLDWAQYALVGSTIRSYLVYLREQERLTAYFDNRRLLWKRT